MKVFISADIEGVTTTNNWDECNKDHPLYEKHAQQMTREVLAACEGAFAGGADEILIKDAHGPAINIDPFQMPEKVTLQRGWSGHPYSMVEGVDKTFDCAMFVGYHSAAGRPGNPLSHTFTGRSAYIKINGRYTSEFMLYSWACALEGVPTVLLCGDKMLCEDYADLHPNLVTVAVKDGVGSLTRNYSTATTLKNIKAAAQKAVSQNLSGSLPVLPAQFDMEIFFKDHWHAEKVSHFPGCKKTAANIITYQTDNFYEILRTLKWIL